VTLPQLCDARLLLRYQACLFFPLPGDCLHHAAAVGRLFHRVDRHIFPAVVYSILSVVYFIASVVHSTLSVAVFFGRSRRCSDRRPQKTLRPAPEGMSAPLLRYYLE
jgi:hypothetical protein